MVGDVRSEGCVRIGTSGWSYDHWRGVFYPDGIAASRRLEFYAGRFDTVEVNATFYGLPRTTTTTKWHDAVPDGFTFAVKGSRYITHTRRIADAGEQVGRFMERIAPLREKTGPLLWQLPPTLKRDDALLDAFLESLPGGLRHAVEFRDESWLADTVYTVLRRHDAAMVNVSGDLLSMNLTPTASFVYVRFHGTTRYHGSYKRPALEPWREFLAEQRAAGRDCYAYFNNDVGGHAPFDAERLRGMLARR